MAYALHGNAGTDSSLKGDQMSSQHARISARAYDLWVRRGRPIGSPEIDWDAAEKERDANDLTPATETLDSLHQQVADVLTNSSETSASGTEAASPDGPVPKRSRPGGNAARQIRDNGAEQPKPP